MRRYDISGMPKDAPGDDWPKWIMPEDLENTFAIFSDAVQRVGSCELQATWKSGASSLINMSPIKLSDGAIKYIGSIVDVTELKRLEKFQLESAEARAADAQAMRKSLELSVDVTSHELRNPLSGVIQAAELLAVHVDKLLTLADELMARNVLDEAAYDEIVDQLVFCEENIETIRLCSLHQRRVADDVLNFSKISASLLTLDPQPADFITLAERSAKMLRSDLEQHSIELKLDIGTGESLVAQYVLLDQHRLGQVLLNLLTNAIRYSALAAARLIELTVRVTADCPPMAEGAMRVTPSDWPLPTAPGVVWCSCSVRDRGRGLSAEERSRLFQRFVQVRPDDGLSGFGLGLFISKSVTHLHGGFLEIESESGVGSTFRFVVPAQVVDPSTVSTLAIPDDPIVGLAKRFSNTPTARGERRRRIRPSLPSAYSAPSAVTTEPATKGTVLVVDDSTINVRLLRRQLELKTYTVITGVDGQEALDLIAVNYSTLLAAFIDCEMPIKNGPTAVRELRQIEHTSGRRRLATAAVTGNARDGQKAACLEAGYDAVFTKPYSIDDLVGFIEAARL